MKYDPQKQHRRSIRLQGYDYAQPGAYFVTMVAWQRECLFGEIIHSPLPGEPTLRLNPYGRIVERAWSDLPKHYPQVQLGTFCIMPNHVHAVIILVEPTVGAGSRGADLRPAPTTQPAPAPRQPLSEMVRAFKSYSAKQINDLRSTPGVPVWQRNFYEHIIRDEEEHQRIHLYIQANPANWVDDDENPANVK
jgi:REP element-mobilizing transposase RayT